MSKYTWTHFFHPSTFPLPTKKKWVKLKFFYPLTFPPFHYFLFSHISTPPTKQILSGEPNQKCPHQTHWHLDFQFLLISPFKFAIIVNVILLSIIITINENFSLMPPKRHTLLLLLLFHSTSDANLVKRGAK